MTTPNSAHVPNRAARVWAHPFAHLIMGLGVLLLDLLTGPYLLFPILFLAPVALSAWFCRTRWAYGLTVVLPLGRLLIAVFVDTPASLPFMIANALIRVVVLALVAYLVARTARQTKALEDRVSGLVTICAWSRTVEFEGEWISFEEYLKRRFGADTSHGISPAEMEKVLAKVNPKDREA